MSATPTQPCWWWKKQQNALVTQSNSTSRGKIFISTHIADCTPCNCITPMRNFVANYVVFESILCGPYMWLGGTNWWLNMMQNAHHSNLSNGLGLSGRVSSFKMQTKTNKCSRIFRHPPQTFSFLTYWMISALICHSFTMKVCNI